MLCFGQYWPRAKGGGGTREYGNTVAACFPVECAVTTKLRTVPYQVTRVAVASPWLCYACDTTQLDALRARCLVMQAYGG